MRMGLTRPISSPSQRRRRRPCRRRRRHHRSSPNYVMESEQKADKEASNSSILLEEVGRTNTTADLVSDKEASNSSEQKIHGRIGQGESELAEEGNAASVVSTSRTRIVKDIGSRTSFDILRMVAALLCDVEDLIFIHKAHRNWRLALDYGFYDAACDPCLLLASPVLKKEAKGMYALSLIRSLGKSSVRPEPVELACSPGRICGTGYGWLVVVGKPTNAELSVSLYNPLSERRLLLPSSASFVCPPFSQSTLVSPFDSARASISLSERSRNPASGCVVVISCSPYHSLSFLKYHPEKNRNRGWTSVEIEWASRNIYNIKLSVYHQHWANIDFDDYYTSCVYHQGFIVALRRSGLVDLVNLTTHVRTKVVPHYTYKLVYDICWEPTTPRIVSTPTSVYLIANVDDEDGDLFIYTLDLVADSPKWNKCYDVRENLFFFDQHNLQAMELASADQRDLQVNALHSYQFEGNCICSFHFSTKSLEKSFLNFPILGIHHARWYLPGF